MVKVLFTFEPWEAIWPEFSALLYSECAPEVSQFQDRMKVQIDYEFYQRMDVTGRLDTIAARDDEILVGYFQSCVLPNPHFLGVPCAYVTHYYLKPAYRGYGYGAVLFDIATAALEVRGVKCVWGGAKVSQQTDRIYERQGWTLIEKLYTRWLGPPTMEK